MKVAVAGKGGSGKTTISALLARGLARNGWSVVALDCDANPNLGIALGLGPEETARLAAIRQSLAEAGIEHAPSAEELLERFGRTGPDSVRLAVVTKIDTPNPG